MIINSNIQYQQRNNNQNQPINLGNNNSPQFKGCVNSVFRFLADEPVWGLTGVDLGSMVFPRTITDTKHRGAAAGFETGFREGGSSANNALIGCYGVLAGALIASTINKKHGIKANEIFASDEAIDIFSAKWKKHNGNIDSYAKDVVDSIKAYNPNSALADSKGFVSIPEANKQAIVEDLKHIATGDTSSMKARWKGTKDRLLTRIVEATGIESSLKLENGAKATSANSKTMMENFYTLTKSFKSEKVGNNIDKFVKDYKHFGKMRTILGISIALLIAMSAQPLNVYMSKKRTGTDGFVGVEGRKKDDSTTFKVIKGASAAAMITMSLGYLGALSKNPLKIPAKFIEKNQYKGKNPTMNMFKSVYGGAIASRMWVSRDKDELREVCTKDVLGFFNWLMLGSVVNKIILHKFQAKDANMLRKAPVEANEGFFYKRAGKKMRGVMDFLSSSIASHTEVLMDGLKKERPDIKSVIKADGKPMKFNEMYKLLPKNGAARKNLRLLNLAQLGGYLYSGLVLGIGIPRLNIALTNHFDKKRKAKIQSQQRVKPATINFLRAEIKDSNFGRLKSSKA